MEDRMKKLVIAIVGLGLVAFISSSVFATAKLKTDSGATACTDCHVKVGAKDLNDVGKKFKAEFDKSKDAKAALAAAKAPAAPAAPAAK